MATPEELVQFTFHAVRVVGWLPRSDFAALTERQRSLLKLVAVDGLKPGDKGYVFSAR